MVEPTVFSDFTTFFIMVFCTKRLLKRTQIPTLIKIKQSKVVPIFTKAENSGLSILQCSTAVLQSCRICQMYLGQ